MVAQVFQLQELMLCKALAEAIRFCVSFDAVWVRVPEELEQLFLDEVWLVTFLLKVLMVLKKPKDQGLIRQIIQGTDEIRLLQHRVTSTEPQSSTNIMQDNSN